MLWITCSERCHQSDVNWVTGLMDFGILYGWYLSGDFFGILVGKNVFAFRELHFANIVGSLGSGWNDEVHLDSLAVRRFSPPTERCGIFLYAQCIGKLRYMFNDKKFEGVACPGKERLPRWGTTCRHDVDRKWPRIRNGLIRKAVKWCLVPLLFR